MFSRPLAAQQYGACPPQPAAGDALDFAERLHAVTATAGMPAAMSTAVSV